MPLMTIFHPLSKSRQILLCGAVLLFSLQAQSQGFSDPSALCDDLTPANRAMAKSAGYNVDELCGSLKAATGGQAKQRQLTPMEPRKTISSVSDGRSDGDNQVREEKSPSRGRLKPFGYDLFAGTPETFAPVTNIPVSPDYLLGPGDTLEILFYGKTNSAVSLEINRDGSVNFPELGPVTLAGLTFVEAKEMLQSRIAAQMIGVQANISLGELRSMQIFVLGEAFKPGAYTVSSLSTITHALFVSGGVNDIASLRNIQLKRAGKTVANFDLYDLLMLGDTSNDVRLQPSDVIYIPTRGDLVSIAGAVLRPAIYELKVGEKVADLVALAGGLKARASVESGRLDRLDGNGFTTVLDINLDQPQSQQLVLRAGDHLQVDGISDRKKKIVTLDGHVDYPGNYAWKEGLRASDLIGNIDQLPPLVDLDFALLVREVPPVGDLETLSVDLRAVLMEPGGVEDAVLSPRDKLLIFSTEDSRAPKLSEVIATLKRQARSGELTQVVTISGDARYPGEYPLTKGMTVQKLIAAAGGLAEEAYTQSIEINRIDLSNPNLASSRSLVVNLAASGGDVSLRPYDDVLVRSIPEYREKNSISLKGEVVFPGKYVFARGETLAQVIERAGGFTDYADVNAAFFSREALREAEAKNLVRLKEKMQEELAVGQLDSVAEGMDTSALALQRDALKQLDGAEAIGRLVIPLQAIIDRRENDIILASGDELIIPQFRQEVMVIGEVQRPTSHMFRSDRRLNDYLEMSGGFKRAADKRAVYLVKSSGEVIVPRSGLFKFNSKSRQIEPGDTIVVPVDPDGSVKVIPLMAEVSRILYELALGAAAVNSFSSP